MSVLIIFINAIPFRVENRNLETEDFFLKYCNAFIVT